MDNNIKNSIYGEVKKLLDKDNTGHGMRHINNVIEISNEISKGMDVNIDTVYLIALLHDVDDYKLVGIDNADDLNNAKRILNKYINDKKLIEDVLYGISTIGYSKRLSGVFPNTQEAKIVSDADMIDAIGATGIMRSIEYNLSKNRIIFDKDMFPKLNMNMEEYKAKNDSTMINHVFEKLLKLKDMMLTEMGYKLALPRHKFMVEFLYQYFTELKLDNWIKYLDEYLKENA